MCQMDRILTISRYHIIQGSIRLIPYTSHRRQQIRFVYFFSSPFPHVQYPIFVRFLSSYIMGSQSSTALDAQGPPDKPQSPTRSQQYNHATRAVSGEATHHEPSKRPSQLVMAELDDVFEGRQSSQPPQTTCVTPTRGATETDVSNSKAPKPPHGPSPHGTSTPQGSTPSSHRSAALFCQPLRARACTLSAALMRSPVPPSTTSPPGRGRANSTNTFRSTDEAVAIRSLDLVAGTVPHSLEHNPSSIGSPVCTEVSSNQDDELYEFMLPTSVTLPQPPALPATLKTHHRNSLDEKKDLSVSSFTGKGGQRDMESQGNMSTSRRHITVSFTEKVFVMDGSSSDDDEVFTPQRGNNVSDPPFPRLDLLAQIASSQAQTSTESLPSPGCLCTPPSLLPRSHTSPQQAPGTLPSVPQALWHTNNSAYSLINATSEGDAMNRSGESNQRHAARDLESLFDVIKGADPNGTECNLANAIDELGATQPENVRSPLASVLPMVPTAPPSPQSGPSREGKMKVLPMLAANVSYKNQQAKKNPKTKK